MTGYVYVMTNEAMPGLCKIGRTKNDPCDRAVSLSSTSCPAPFVVAHQHQCEEYRQIERHVHKQLSHCRYTRRREFFKCTVEQAKTAIADTVDLAAKGWVDEKHEKERNWRSLMSGETRYPQGMLRIDSVLCSLLERGWKVSDLCAALSVRGAECAPYDLVKVIRGRIPDYVLGSAIRDLYMDHCE